MNYYNYFTEIEETFVRRRGKNLFLSPLDWALMEVWQERGIPLHVVIRSIESVFDVFDKQPVGTRTIKSLFYCREEIEAQYVEWTNAQVGASANGREHEEDSDSMKERVSAHINDAITSLESNPMAGLREDLDRAISRLLELNECLPDDPETIDATLSDIERLIERSMLTNWDREHLTILKKEVAAQLCSYKAEMEKEAYEQTFSLMLTKRLRDEAGIPRLGLYYL